MDDRHHRERNTNTSGIVGRHVGRYGNQSVMCHLGHKIQKAREPTERRRLGIHVARNNLQHFECRRGVVFDNGDELFHAWFVF